MIGLSFCLLLVSLQTPQDRTAADVIAMVKAAALDTAVVIPLQITTEGDLAVTRYVYSSTGAVTYVTTWTDPFTGMTSPIKAHVKVRGGGGYAEWNYTENAWYSSGGPITANLPSTYYYSVNKITGTANIYWWTRYTGSSDVAAFTAQRNADGTYRVMYMVYPNGIPKPYFSAAGTWPASAVTWY